MTSPFGAGQVSPSRLSIKLNVPSENGDVDMNGHADVKLQLNGTPELVAHAPSDVGPSRAASVVTHTPERPSPAPSSGMLDRSFGHAEPPEPYSQPQAISAQPSPDREGTLKSSLVAESKNKPVSKPSTPVANGLMISGQKTHRKVSCELCHRRKIKVRHTTAYS